jgi:hypothetical protein
MIEDIRWVLFQLPLSGSHYLLGAGNVKLKSFQLPLSGSRSPQKAKPERSEPGILSTPSLGITEPYSGIFRLSAAFRRGTSSHR